uniref:ATP-dependent DNA helicase n=1 Tax=Panagrolaimus sp. PS1159 TaxID=55785 RepID=A0AC35FDU9_9BILA
MPTDAYLGDFEFGDDYNSDELNLFEDASIPPHSLSLNIGSVVMLTRNVSVRLGQCNGTRMVVVELFESSVKCIIMTGDHAGEAVPVFPMANMYNNTEATEVFPAFSRFQLPVRPAFAMTINKSQGQTLKRVGIILESQCFAHGQLYVALSRVRSRDDIKVYVPPQHVGQCNGAQIPHATNIVFPEVLKTIKVLTVDVPTPPPLSWRSFPSPSNFMYESPLSSQRIWNWSSQSAAAASSVSTSQHLPPYAPTPASFLSPSPAPLLSPTYPAAVSGQSTPNAFSSHPTPSWRSFPSPSN